MSAPSEQGDISALAEHFGFGERNGVVFDWHVLDGLSVEDLGLEEDARIGITDTGQEKSLGLDGTARDDDLDTGRVGKEGLNALGVI